MGGRYFGLIWNRTNDHSRCRWFYEVRGEGEEMQTWGNLRHMCLSDSTVPADGGVSTAPQIKSTDNKSPFASICCVICRTWPGHGLDMISVDLCDILQTCNFSSRFRFSSALMGSLFYSLSFQFASEFINISFGCGCGDLFWAFSHKSK